VNLEYRCPKCGSSYYGSSGNPPDSRGCHDQFGVGCHHSEPADNDWKNYVFTCSTKEEFERESAKTRVSGEGQSR